MRTNVQEFVCARLSMLLTVPFQRMGRPLWSSVFCLKKENAQKIQHQTTQRECTSGLTNCITNALNACIFTFTFHTNTHRSNQADTQLPVRRPGPRYSFLDQSFQSDLWMTTRATKISLWMKVQMLMRVCTLLVFPVVSQILRGRKSFNQTSQSTWNQVLRSKICRWSAGVCVCELSFSCG